MWYIQPKEIISEYFNRRRTPRDSNYRHTDQLSTSSNSQTLKSKYLLDNSFNTQ